MSSSVRAMRRRAMCSLAKSTPAGSLRKCSLISLGKKPSTSVLTRTPRSPQLAASVWVMLAMPALDAPYSGVWSGQPPDPPAEPMLMIEPPPSRSMRTPACLQPYQAPSRFTVTFSIASSSDSRSGMTPGPACRPALLTMTSIRPCCRQAVSTSASTSSEEVTSQRTAVATPPSERMPRATCSSLSARRAPMTTLAPAAASARAIVTPQPDDAPVTTAEAPLRSNRSTSSISVPPDRDAARRRLANTQRALRVPESRGTIEAEARRLLIGQVRRQPACNSCEELVRWSERLRHTELRLAGQSPTTEVPAELEQAPKGRPASDSLRNRGAESTSASCMRPPS